MTIMIVVLSILLIASIYVNINLTRKYEKLDDMAQESVDALIENEKFLTSLKNRLLSQQSYLRQLDRIGAFEADDETGYFFKELKSIVNDISLYFGENPIDDDKANSVLANLKFQEINDENKYDVKFEYKKDYYV
jgi:competence protein ComGC